MGNHQSGSAVASYYDKQRAARGKVHLKLITQTLSPIDNAKAGQIEQLEAKKGKQPEYS